MYCSKSTGLQDFRAEPTWSYPSSTSPSPPVQMSWGYPALHDNTPSTPRPTRANILGASTAGFAAPYQLFNFPGSTTSSFLEAAACQPAAILWSGVDRARCGRIKPCTLSEKVLFLVLLFLFFSPTLRNYSYSNWLPPPAWGMENNFFSVQGRRNGMVSGSCCQQENDPWVTARALRMGFCLQGSGAAEILDSLSCYSQKKQQEQGEADRLHFCKIVVFLGSFSLVCLGGG